jgi:biotin transport system substrate-specific component
LYAAMKFIVEKPFTVAQTLLFGFVLPIPGDILLCIICSIIAAKALPRTSFIIHKQGVAS